MRDHTTALWMAKSWGVAVPEEGGIDGGRYDEDRNVILSINQSLRQWLWSFHHGMLGLDYRLHLDDGLRYLVSMPQHHAHPRHRQIAPKSSSPHFLLHACPKRPRRSRSLSSRLPHGSQGTMALFSTLALVGQEDDISLTAALAFGAPRCHTSPGLRQHLEDSPQFQCISYSLCPHLRHYQADANTSDGRPSSHAHPKRPARCPRHLPLKPRRTRLQPCHDQLAYRRAATDQGV